MPDKIPLSKYKTPDSRWEAFGVNSFEEYESKYIIKGKFHSGVPKDVTEAYETAEYIMAQAYFHYPLLDEAANKLLRIMEMAIKKRATEIDISLTFTDRNEKVRKKDLNRLINELNKSEREKNLTTHLHIARELRNSLMHPEVNSSHGMVAMNIYEQMINLFNELFLPNSYFAEKNEILERAENELQTLRKGLYVLEIDSKRFLIQGAEPISFDKIGEEWVSFWVANAVYKEFKKLVKGIVLDPPIFFGLKGYRLDDSGELFGTLLDGAEIRIVHCTSDIDKAVYKQFLIDQESMNTDLLEPYKLLINSKIGRELMAFRYRNCWN